MSLEEEINVLLGTRYKGNKPIEKRSWSGRPLSENHPTTKNKLIDKYIQATALEQCLISPSEYIRECKKYFENNQNKLQSP